MNVIRQIIWTIICMLLISGTVMHNTSNSTKNEIYNKNVQNTTSTKTSRKLSEVKIIHIISCVPLFIILLYIILIFITHCYKYCREMRLPEAALLHLITVNRLRENQQHENQQQENQLQENQQDENQQRELLPALCAMLRPGNVL
nr:PREDICTED: uncharacterized protein LOC105670205 isoform X1 [Linepithema humile]